MTKNLRLQLVVFDWAGTTVDFGSRAPAAAFKNVFAAHNVDVSDAEARKPMGLNKREHLISMLSEPPIADRWASAHGSGWTEADVDTMYAEFMPLQLKAIEDNAELIPGVLEVATQLRAAGMKIGGTTGYFTAAAEAVLQRATAAGFSPDANACADDVPQGRPAPWMIFKIMQTLGVYPPACVIKVGDTIADIGSGVNAGCWSVGVCDSSSVMGLSLEEYQALSEPDRTTALQATRDAFLAAGAHAVLDTISELPALTAKINAQLANGDRPQ